MKTDKGMIAHGLKNMKSKPMKDYPKETCCAEPMHDEYPWGLRIDLNDDSMKKLGLTADKFSVEDEVTCIIKCKVTRIESREDTYDDGKKEEIVLQITDMKIETYDE